MGTWIEPVLLSEWSALIRRYAERMGLAVSEGVVEGKLIWQEPERDTALARSVTLARISRGEEVSCVWSDAPLRGAAFDIDHAIPWSAWPCGDLWNLFPATTVVNQRQKRDRLPSALILDQASDNIMDWWRLSWLSDNALAVRFEAEAISALPPPSHHPIQSELLNRRLLAIRDKATSGDRAKPRSSKPGEEVLVSQNGDDICRRRWADDDRLGRLDHLGKALSVHRVPAI